SSAYHPGPSFMLKDIAFEHARITRWTIAFAVGSTVPVILLAAGALVSCASYEARIAALTRQNIRRRRRKLHLLLGDDV
ncbi:hypothetical protein Q0N58_15330, partial [Staphylococcus aureus]|nr:hypothetical protein [Staphylococcus aureus]